MIMMGIFFPSLGKCCSESTQTIQIFSVVTNLDGVSILSGQPVHLISFPETLSSFT